MTTHDTTTTGWLIIICLSISALILFFMWINYKFKSSQPDWLQKYWRSDIDEEGNIYWEQTDKPKTK